MKPLVSPTSKPIAFGLVIDIERLEDVLANLIADTVIEWIRARADTLGRSLVSPVGEILPLPDKESAMAGAMADVLSNIAGEDSHRRTPGYELWGNDVRCCRAIATIADLSIGGKVGQCAANSAKSGSIAALFAALLEESADSFEESPIVRPLSWALSDPTRTALSAAAAEERGSFVLFCANCAYSAEEIAVLL